VAIPQLGDIGPSNLTRNPRSGQDVAVLQRVGTWMEPSAATGALPTKVPHREPLEVMVLAVIGLIGLGTILLSNHRQLGLAVSTRGPELLVWAVLILLVNLFFHFENESLQFTLDVPLLLAASALYEPPVVAALALVSEVDVREVERRVSLARALYNRAQIAISVFAASGIFHAAGSVQGPWPRSLVAMGLAWAIFYLLNGAFVMAAVSIREGVPFYRVAGFLRVGRPIQFLMTYLGYGIFALVLARLFRDVGPWAVVLFLVPLLVAHVALVRAERLYSLTEELHTRQRLLELLSNRMVEERRDERLRIASDLHDEVLQDVTRIWMQSRFASDLCADDGALARDIRQLVSDSETTLASLRNVISDLKRSPLGRGGLVSTIDQLVRDLKLDWGKRIDFQRSNMDLASVSSDIQLVAYQVVREGLTNALKHSHASRIVVSLALIGEGIEASVRDDGVGFLPKEVDVSNHFGLGLIRERVRMVGGDLVIQSNPGEGSHLRASLPRGGSVIR
jgi:signal transduction histidine kinase